MISRSPSTFLFLRALSFPTPICHYIHLWIYFVFVVLLPKKLSTNNQKAITMYVFLNEYENNSVKTVSKLCSDFNEIKFWVHSNKRTTYIHFFFSKYSNFKTVSYKCNLWSIHKVCQYQKSWAVFLMKITTSKVLDKLTRILKWPLELTRLR